MKDFIESVLADKKLSGAVQTEKVYTDEPLLFTASQMSSYTPPKYAEMRKIASSHEAYEISEVQIFYRQAKFMADFEDDYARREDFFRYYPTYQAMNNRQLRSYFAWRTRLRHGQVEHTSLSFAFVYIYELLNLAGVASPQEGYDKLKAFAEVYGEIEPYIMRYLDGWLNDFVIYHSLDSSLLSLPDQPCGNELLLLLHSDEHGDDEVFSALCSLSSYNLLNSSFYKKHPDTVRQVVCRCYKKLSTFFAAHRKNSFNEKLFGSTLPARYYPFRSAIVFEEVRHADCVYRVNDLLSYRCENGVWFCDRFFTFKGKSKPLGELLKYIDCALRQRCGFKSSMKPVVTTRVFSDNADEAIEEYFKEKAERAKPKIEIDLSKLDSIRETALVTQSKLIVEDEPSPVVPPPAPPPVEKAEAKKSDARLGEVKSGFLRCLLAGENAAEYCRTNSLMLSVLVDEINDELFEDFGDTVLDFCGDEPFVIEDYLTDVKGLVCE